MITLLLLTFNLSRIFVACTLTPSLWLVNSLTPISAAAILTSNARLGSCFLADGT